MGSEFSLEEAKHKENLRKILKNTGAVQVSILYQSVTENPQSLTIRGKPPKPTASQDGDQQLAMSTTGSAHGPDNVDDYTFDDGSNDVYAIGSYSKVIFNYALSRCVHGKEFKKLGITWGSRACKVFNDHRRKGGGSQIRGLLGDPTIKEMASHKNGIAQMNRYHFGHDDSFLPTEEDFLQDAVFETERKFRERKSQNRDWIEYSNANHIFLALLLKAVLGQPLATIIREKVLVPLNMTRTFIDEESLGDLADDQIVQGHHQSPNNSGWNDASAKRYLSNSLAASSLGFMSTTADLAKLNRESIKSLISWPNSLFTEKEMDEFFDGRIQQRNGPSSTLAGFHAPLNDKILAEESPSSAVLRNPHDHYRLGRRKGFEPCKGYKKCGSITGFTSTVCVCLQDRAFVIVLGNTTGVLDPTDQVAQYVLTHAFKLFPRPDREAMTIKASNLFRKALLDQNSQAVNGRDADENDQYLIGTYRHEGLTHTITISPTFECREGCTKHQAKPMRIVWVANDTLQLVPKVTDYGIEILSVWNQEGRCFQVQRGTNSEVFLVSKEYGDRYRKINAGAEAMPPS
jgi:CubicO group peptidase (beta-lactamase class C family)